MKNQFPVLEAEKCHFHTTLVSILERILKRRITWASTCRAWFFYILPWQLESLRLFKLQVTAQCAISACKREDNDAWHAAVTLSGCPDAKSVGCIHRTHKEFDANLSHRAQMGHFRQPAKVYWPLQAKAPDTSVDHGAECLPVVQEHSETSLRHTLNKMMVED